MSSRLSDLVGRTAVFSKTVSESDVYQFAGISGDFYAAHVDPSFMATTPLGKRVAHGALLVGFMSAASTRLIEQVGIDGTVPLSLGYDRIRFVAPVFLGDMIHTRYVVKSYDADRQRSSAEIESTNQAGAVVAVATHLLKWTSRNER